ncbi:MAG TPA: YihY family inner membrane protein [Usitatibacter sp.]|nr:YihY family inner membrane protein [Usitatibacter sp.]
MRGKATLVDFLGYLRFVLRRWTEDRCPQIAGSLTFTTLLALVPTFAIAVSLLSALPFFDDVLVQIKVFLLLNLVPEIAGRIITVYMEEFRHNAMRLTTVGVLVLFATAAAMILTVDRSINAIWRVRATRRWWVSLLAYVLLLVTGPLLIGVSVSATTYLMMTISNEMPEQISSKTHSFLLQIVPISMSALAFFLLYRLVPRRKVPWVDAMVGGIIAAVMFELAKEVFAIYVRLAPLSVVYGAFAAVPFFLLWMYISWLVVLLGAELAASLGDWRTGRWRSAAKSPHLGDAVGVVRALLEAKGQALSFARLAETAGMPHADLEDVLDHLVASGLVARTDQGGEAYSIPEVAAAPKGAAPAAAAEPAKKVRTARRGKARSARSSR